MGMNYVEESLTQEVLGYVSTIVGGAVSRHVIYCLRLSSKVPRWKGEGEKRVLLWHGKPYRVSGLLCVLWYTSILFLLHV